MVAMGDRSLNLVWRACRASVKRHCCWRYQYCDSHGLQWPVLLPWSYLSTNCSWGRSFLPFLPNTLCRLWYHHFWLHLQQSPQYMSLVFLNCCVMVSEFFSVAVCVLFLTTLGMLNCWGGGGGGVTVNLFDWRIFLGTGGSPLACSLLCPGVSFQEPLTGAGNFPCSVSLLLV